MPAIDRYIINPNINYDGLNRDNLFSLINRWKRLLIFGHDVKHGDVLALGIFDVNANHIACLFAAAELGLKVLIITKPLTRETIDATKMGIFGPVDITISQDLDPDDLHVEMFKRHSKKICYESEIDAVTNDREVNAWPKPDDILIFASTSGTTGNSKPVLFSHDEVFKISQRNIDIFGFTKDTIVQQTMNMHHASAMLTYLLPSLMVCDIHHVGPIAYGPHLYKKVWTPTEFVEQCLSENKVDTIICSNIFFLKLLLEGFDQTDVTLDHRVTLNISGFPATEELYEISKRYPINFISHYGSIDTGIPLLVNNINESSLYKKNFIGTVPDDFYIIQGNTVKCELWSSPRKIADDIVLLNDGYYYNGRETDALIDDELIQNLKEQNIDFTITTGGNKKCLVIWDNPAILETRGTFVNKIFDIIVHLKKQEFIVDTKVSMEQLRAYLEHHYAV